MLENFYGQNIGLTCSPGINMCRLSICHGYTMNQPEHGIQFPYNFRAFLTANICEYFFG